MQSHTSPQDSSDRLAPAKASQSNGQLTISERLLAAGVAGAVTGILTNPFDVLKTRLQAQDAAQAPASPASQSERQCHRPASSLPVRRTWPSSSYHFDAPDLASSSHQRWATRLSTPRWERHPATIGHACLCTTQVAPGMQLPFYHCTNPPTYIPHTSHSQPQFNNMRSLLRNILQHEGMAGLWRGLDSALLMTLPTVLLYYPMYDFLYLSLTSGSQPGPCSGTTSTSGSLGDLGAGAPMIAGAAARTVAAVAVAPLELMRTRQQAMGRQATTWQVLRSSLGLDTSPAAPPATSSPSQVLRRVPQLWTGLSATLARDVPFSAAYWGLVEPLRAHLVATRAAPTWGMRQDREGELQGSISHRDLVFANLVAGSIAGTAAAVITTPFDVVKTVMQIAPLGHSRTSSAGGPSTGRRSFTSVLHSVYTERGLPGLFVGVGPRAARCAPACAIAVASYEWVKATLAK